MQRCAIRLAGAAVAVALVAGLATGCGIRIPSDPEGTTDRVTGGELRVGASADPGRVTVTGDEVSGPLPELVEDFAASLDAEVVWTVAAEETLVTALEQGEIDLAVGGMTDQTPWSDRAAVTRSFPDLPGVEGDHPVVFLAPLGENRFVSALETFLDEQVSG